MLSQPFVFFFKSWLSERRLLKKRILEAASVLINKSLTPRSSYKINYSKLLITERKQHLQNTFLFLRMQFTSLLMNPSVIKRFQTTGKTHCRLILAGSNFS